MEQHNQEIGTRRDLVLYRLETARNDLKSAGLFFHHVKKEYPMKIQEMKQQLQTPDTDESSHLNHTFLERAWEFFQTRSHSITEIYKL